METDLINFYLANAKRCELCDGILSLARLAALRKARAGALLCVDCEGDPDEVEADQQEESTCQMN